MVQRRTTASFKGSQRRLCSRFFFGFCRIFSVVLVLSNVVVHSSSSSDADAVIDSGKFRCANGQHVIDAKFVNDDFCDCADGSDEPNTAACGGHGLFQCHVSPALQIPKSKVNDGLCDCCDGSDEQHTICAVTCVEDVDETLALLHRHLNAVVKGLELSAQFRQLFPQASASVGGLRQYGHNNHSTSKAHSTTQRVTNGGPTTPNTMQRGNNQPAPPPAPVPVALTAREFMSQLNTNMSTWARQVKHLQEQSVAYRQIQPQSRTAYNKIRAALVRNSRQASLLSTQIKVSTYLLFFHSFCLFLFFVFHSSVLFNKSRFL